jgi:5-methylcytosine-specific restriction endonuclease McrA
MPTLLRPCPRCRTALIAAPAQHCLPCARTVSASRGTTTARGLGWSYQRKRERILARDGYICWLCGLPGADSVDHVTPRVRGGDDSDENLRAAHGRCNSGRR